MQFLDKLEKLLLDPTFTLKCRFGNTKKHILQISTEGREDEELDQEFIDKSIKELIIYLKDPINYKSEEYQYFSLVFIGERNGKKLWTKILELNPTEDQLIHLYKYAAFTKSFLMTAFLEALNTKKSKLELVKLGYDGEDHKNYRRIGLDYSNIREILYCLSWHNEKISEDEYVDIIHSYIKNSNNFTESKAEIIDTSYSIINNQHKSTKLIKELFGEEIPIKNVIESNIRKVELHPFFIVGKFTIPTQEIHKYLNNFEKQLNKHLDLMLDIYYLHYYISNQRGDDGYYLHNFIFESNSNKSDEIIEMLDVFQQSARNYLALNENTFSWDNFYLYLDKNPSFFGSLILERNLSKTCTKKDDVKEKFVKI